MFILTTILFACLYFSERSLRKETAKWEDYWYNSSQKWMKQYFRMFEKARKLAKKTRRIEP